MFTRRILALVLVLLFVLAGLPVPSASADDAAAAYAPVLEKLKAGLSNTDDPFAMEEDFSYMFFVSYTESQPGALLADLNGDGTPELLLGNAAWDADVYGPAYFYDLYTLVDGEPVHVVSSGERYRYYLRRDGQIGYQGSGGAAYSYAALYRFGGVGLQCVGMVLTDEYGCYYADFECYESYSATPIDDATWQACAQSFCSELVDPLPFAPLDQAPAQLQLSARPRGDDAAYTELTRQYRRALAQPQFYRAAEMPLVHGELLYDSFIEPDGFEEGSPALRWLRRDLNGDGSDELILTRALLGDYGMVLDETAYEVYTIIDGQARPLFELQVGPRWGSRLVPTRDGHLWVTRSDRQLEIYHLDASGALQCDGIFTPDDSMEVGAHYVDAAGNRYSSYEMWQSAGGSVLSGTQDF